MIQHRKQSLRAGEAFHYPKLTQKNHNYRYCSAEDQEPKLEPWDENSLFNNTLLTLKPWIMQQMSLKNFESIYFKLFSCNFEVKKEEFCKEIEKFQKSGKNFEELAEVLIKFSEFKGKTEDYQDLSREFTKRISLNSKNVMAGEKVKRKLMNIETKLDPIKPQTREKTSKGRFRGKIEEIFDFFSLEYYKKKRLNYAVDQRPPGSLSQEYFLHFCRSFHFFEFSHITEDLLSNIFKKNSLYHKVMHKEHFMNSLQDLSKLLFSVPSSLSKLFEIMGLQNDTYKLNLIPKKEILDYSSSEKQLNQTAQHRNLSRIGRFNNKLSRLEKINEIKAPKTTGYNTRTPITWKELNATDLSQLGEEFDVRKEIFPKFVGATRLNSLF